MLAAGGTFVLGFGVMNAFWFLGKHPPELPGHWDYRAPIIGDGVFLPVAAGILVATLESLPPSPRERRIALGSALFGATVGAGSQWAWLRDSAPSATWILPEPHHFTLAGWYHAVFLVAASAWFSGSGMAVLWRLRSLRQEKGSSVIEQALRSPWTAILFACLFGFAALAVLDSTPSLTTAASQGSVVALILAIVVSLALMRWVLGPVSMQSWKGVASGGVFALGLGWLTAGWDTTFNIGSGDVIVVVLIAIALATELVAWRSRHWALHTVSASVWLLAGLNSAANTPAGGWSDLGWPLLPVVVAYIAFVTIVLGLVDAPRGALERRVLVFVLPVPLALTAVAAWLERQPNTLVQANVLEMSFTALVLFWLVRFGQRRWGSVIRDQEALDRGFVVESSFIAGWITITSILTATVAAYLRMIDASGPALGLDSPQMVRSPYPFHILWVGVAALLLTVPAGWLAHPRTSSHESYLLNIRPDNTLQDFSPSPLSVPVLPWMLAALSTLVWSAMPILVWLAAGQSSWDFWTVRLDTIGWIFIILSAPIATWLIATSFINLWGSVAEIEFYRLGKKEMTLVWLTSVSIGTNAYWLLTIGLWSDHRIVRLIDIASSASLVVLGGIVVAVGTTLVIIRSTPLTGVIPRYLALHHPATTIGQDFLLHGFMLMFAVTMLFVAYRFSESDVSAWVAVAVAIFPLIAVYGQHVLLTKNLYDQHILSERHIVIEQDRQSLLARVNYDINCAHLLNQHRCDAIQRRAKRINHLALILAPPLLALRVVSWSVQKLLNWIFGPPNWVAGSSPHMAVINESQELPVPDRVLAYLGIGRGDRVAFVIDKDMVRLQPARKIRSTNLGEAIGHGNDPLR